VATQQETVYALAFGAHPDDVELSCGATLLKIMDEGHSVAVCDLTRGEMGTLGTQETREAEASQAAKVMGYSRRLQLDLGDSYIRSDRDSLEKVIAVIRRLRPHIVFTNPPDERHPDHAKASRIVSEAVFYAGLKKLSTKWEGTEQQPHRPVHLLHYMQYRHFDPSLIVDITKTFERSRKGVLAFGSQFYREGRTSSPQTLIQRREFLTGLEARARYLGEQIGVLYGEGFSLPGPLGVPDFTALFPEK